MSQPSVMVPVAVGLLLLIAAVALRRDAWLIWAMFALAGGCAVWLSAARGPRVAVVTPLIAAALLLLGEVAFPAAARGSDRAFAPRRQLPWLGAVATGAILTSTLVLLIGTLDVRRSVLITLAGTVAILVVIALVRVVSGQIVATAPQEAARDQGGGT